MSTLTIWIIVLYIAYLVFKVLDALMEDSVTYEQQQHEARHNKRKLKKKVDK